MSSRGRQGAAANVQRAMGWNGIADQVMRTQMALCPMCGAELRFTTGEYGQTLELCTSRAGCPLRRPHAPRPDPDTPLKPAHVKKKRRGPYGTRDE
jgi:hypothetical protein